MDARAARFIENLAKERRELAAEIVDKRLDQDKYCELQAQCACLQQVIEKARAHFKGEDDEEDGDNRA